MPLTQIGQFALPVTDADRAEAFYGGKLGLRKLFRYGELVFFDCGGVRIMLEGGTRPVHPTASVCHYFKVDGIEAVRAELAGKGVPFVDEAHLVARMPDHELWMTFFSDPDGHLLALMEEKR
jgi:methylmalonyl-CoA/ethylmalonyl-CoA epimerase